MSGYGQTYQPGFGPHPPQPAPATPAKSVLPMVSLVLSALALLGVLGIAGFLASSGAFAGGGNAPLTGQLTSAPTGTLRGADLVDQLTDVIRSDGGDVGDLRCPDTPSVAQGVVTVCHGTISGGAWAVAVFFEDGQGRFTALPM